MELKRKLTNLFENAQIINKKNGEAIENVIIENLSKNAMQIRIGNIAHIIVRDSENCTVFTKMPGYLDCWGIGTSNIKEIINILDEEVNLEIKEKVETNNETEYLMATKANREHLEKSIKNLEK